ncbi:SRPBCC domain-containing protein [Ideonella sp. A 288]|uniref:SRPBCC domain-containing protein n=1 Tax=Ideonella sp. A 288 TaxID=1962181 RepID=UPI000B4B1558|nr:SRPBCC domain-containing protein [Ideonella sp. A 288]
MEPIESRSDSRRKWLEASPPAVFSAMSDPDRVARWWGPDGFTNTIHQFEFTPGGQWLLTMHGPDGKHYPNESRFTRIVADQIFEIEHLNGHHFFLTIELVPVDGGTEVRWQQTFDTAEHYQRIAEFVASANEQNLERLAAEVDRATGAASPQ